jgi:dTDP-4-dehydrorhamnose 3,5-epimerase
MIFTKTKLEGAYIIDVEQRRDDRGFFGRIWCRDEMVGHGLNADILQANISYNKYKGTLRGLHYQKEPFAECKLVRCTAGALYDVIVDIRPESPTFKQWIGVELTGENFRSIYVPEGFAHGFITLAPHTSVHYMVTQSYSPGAERGLRYDDPEFKIEWPLEPVLISEKDKSHPAFSLYEHTIAQP